MKLHQQEVVEADHVVQLIYGKYRHKSCEELPECKIVSKSIPDRDHPYSQDHKNAEHHKCPSDGSCPVEQFVISLKKYFLRFFRCRSEKFLILNKSHC